MKIIELKRLDKSISKHPFYTCLNSKKLALIFPGSGYSVMAPYHYYLTNFFTELGYSVFNVDLDYRYYPEIDKRKEFLLYDIEQVFNKALELEDWDEIIICSKSLFTRGIVEAFSNELFKGSEDRISFVFATPCWADDKALEIFKSIKSKSLHIIGTRDPAYKEIVEESLRKHDKDILVLKGADHGLDIHDSTFDSIKMMETISKKIESFIK